jgi:hypothetical protein
MYRRAGRGRTALFLGAAVVIGLAYELRDHHIALLSWRGVAISLPILIISALLLSFIMHCSPPK